MSQLQKAQSIYFIGIGGIGISAVARMMAMEGKKVAGSDRGSSKVTEELERAGVTVFIGHNAGNIPTDCDLVIYTVAIPPENPEFVESKKRGIPLLTYPQTLDMISVEKFTIAVSGTHGKTTTTAMISKIMIDAGLDPTVIVGSLMKNPNGGESNFIAGKSKYLVVEADEYKKSFHNLHPSALVINNIDEDHLDFYKDLTDIQSSFREVALQVPADSFIVTDFKNEKVKPALDGVVAKVIDYKAFMDDNLILKIPGKHNRSNAAAASAVCAELGISKSQIRKSLEDFDGPWRRFEFKGTTKNGAIVYDDYAHNPQKVEAAIEGARELFPDKKIIIVFQPHLFSRTKALFYQFTKAFHLADHVILAPIYPAREPFDSSINSEMLAFGINKEEGDDRAVSLPDFSSIESYLLAHHDNSSTVIVTMGAGEGNKIAEAIVLHNT